MQIYGHTLRILLRFATLLLLYFLGEPKEEVREEEEEKKELETGVAVDHEGWAENFYYLLLRS